MTDFVMGVAHSFVFGVIAGAVYFGLTVVMNIRGFAAAVLLALAVLLTLSLILTVWVIGE